MRRYRDWFRQAKRKLESAKWDLSGEFYEDACFSSQQAAELAAKALLEKRGISRRGHSIYFMLSTIKAPEELLGMAKKLDQYYVPTRYPNGFDVGAPMDYYDKSQAEEAIKYAERIIGFVEEEIGQI